MKETEYKIHYKNFDSLKDKLGVYLIRNLDNNKLKIGITNDLDRRFKEIKKSFQFCGVIPRLEIECYIEYEYNFELEQYLHNQLKEFNHQNEWFSIDDINIILNRLQDFVHIEPKINNDFKIENNISKNIRKELKTNDITYNYYYLYTYEDVKFYIRHDEPNEEYNVVDIIDKTYSKVYNCWNHFHVVEDWGIIKNPIITSISKDIKQLFDKYNTNAIVQINETEYISLELYFLKEYKQELILKFNENKAKIINKLNTVSFESNCNIDDLNSSINNIENLCIDIQKDLNNCIRYNNLKNYKKLG